MIDFSNIGKAEELLERAEPLKDLLRDRLNLPQYIEQKPVELTQNVIYRLALMVSLSTPETPRL